MEFTIDPQNQTFNVLDGVVYNKDMTTLIWYPGGKSWHFDIPDFVTSLRRSAFSGGLITSVDMSDSIITTGFDVFSFCENLESVKLSSNLEIISSYDYDGHEIHAQRHPQYDDRWTMYLKQDGAFSANLDRLDTDPYARLHKD